MNSRRWSGDCAGSAGWRGVRQCAGRESAWVDHGQEDTAAPGCSPWERTAPSQGRPMRRPRHMHRRAHPVGLVRKGSHRGIRAVGCCSLARSMRGRGRPRARRWARRSSASPARTGSARRSVSSWGRALTAPGARGQPSAPVTRCSRGRGPDLRRTVRPPAVAASRRTQPAGVRLRLGEGGQRVDVARGRHVAQSAVPPRITDLSGGARHWRSHAVGGPPSRL